MTDQAGPPPAVSAAPVAATGTRGVPLRPTLRRALAGLVGLLAVVLAVVVAGPGTTPGFPLDPRSTEHDGLAALVALLESFEVTVTIGNGPPTDTTATVFVPVDQLSTERRAQLRAFAYRGGTLVVGGADSPTHGLEAAGTPISDLFGQTTRAPACDALVEVTAIVSTNWAGMDRPADATGCFGADDETAWLVATPHGRGTIIALGSVDPFTNGMLDQEDNAVLALRLLAPSPATAVLIMPRPEVGEGDTPLLELVSDGVWWGLGLLLAAVITLALSTARRLGPPVVERLPPVLPSAELARSVGRLLLRTGDRQAAVTRLRADLRRQLRRQLGLPPDAVDQTLAEQVVHQTAATPADVRLAIYDNDVDSDRALIEISAAIARVRRAAVRPPRPGSATPMMSPRPRHEQHEDDANS